MACSSSNEEVCFICEAKTEEKLSKIRNQTGLLKLVTESGNAVALANLKNTNEKQLRYHQTCKTVLFNSSKKEERKRISDAGAQKEVEKQKRRRTAGKVDSAKRNLLYKNKCILCNEQVSLYLNNPDKRDYTAPDNVTSKNLMNRLNNAVDDRLASNPDDKWAVEVKGRLSGINDLVAQIMQHKIPGTTQF